MYVLLSIVLVLIIEAIAHKEQPIGLSRVENLDNRLTIGEDTSVHYCFLKVVINILPSNSFQMYAI